MMGEPVETVARVAKARSSHIVRGWASSVGARMARLEPLRRGKRSTMASPFFAIYRRLIITNLLVVTAILAAIGLAVYAFAVHAADQQIDQQLVSWATHETPDALTEVEAPNTAAKEISYTPSSPNVFSITLGTQQRVILDENGVRRYGLPDWASAQPVLTGRKAAEFTTVHHGAHSYRLYTVPVRDDDQTIAALQVGTSLDLRDQQLHAMAVVLWLIGIGVLLLTIGSSAYLTNRALVPAQQAFVRQRQFAAAASHELRTPLALIRSQAELLTDHRCDTASGDASAAGEDAASVHKDAQDIIAETDYMARLVGDLLLIARDEHDHRVLSWGLVDLRETLTAAATKVAALAEAQGLTIKVMPSAGESGGHTDDAPAAVWGDADRLRQLVLILLDNAIRYTPSGGTIRVEMRTEPRSRLFAERGHHVSLLVSDTGVGIAPEHLAHVFEPFYHAARPRAAYAGKERDSGMGLGLALAHWIAHAHNGTISVRSSVGIGSVFTVTLPLASDKA